MSGRAHDAWYAYQHAVIDFNNDPCEASGRLLIRALEDFAVSWIDDQKGVSLLIADYRVRVSDAIQSRAA